jgi:hypothetical protein
MWLITMMYFWCSLCNFLRVFSLCFSVFSCCLGGSSFFSNLFDYFCLTGWPLTGEITCHTVLGFLPALSLSSSLSSPLSRLASSSLTIPYGPCRSSSPFLILFQWRIEGLALTIASGGTARGGGARP